MEKLVGLQYLRAIAAIMVVLFHAAYNSGRDFDIGMAGVDIFFVLSGFLMWQISANASPLSFLRNRIRRIVPVYWIITLLVALAVVLGFFRTTLVTVPYLLSSLFFVPMASPAKGTVFPLLQPGWTLNYEMFFYALFAVTLLWSRPTRLVLLTSALAGLVVIGAIFQPEGVIPKFYTNPIILEFLLGALLAFAINGGSALPTVGIAMLMIAVDPVRAWIAIPAVLLVWATLRLEPRLPQWRWLEFLGDASYSIYLWHSLAISACLRVSLALKLPDEFVLIAGIPAGIGLGVAGYILLEKPLLRRASKTEARLATVQP